VENCRGCGSLLDPGHVHDGDAAGERLESVRPADATRLGRECPLCGQQTAPPVFHRKSVQLALLLVRNWYDEAGRIVRQVHANGATFQFRYRMAANKYYAEEATVGLPGGATRSFSTGDSVTQLLRDLKP
jgi:hypothetical protein